MKQIQGVRDIVDDYDTFLLDMWGVMHDGSVPFDGVLECIQLLKAANKRMVILSNSSKRQDNSVKMLTKLGFDPSDFESIITSGEVSWNMLSGNLKNEWLEEHVSDKKKNVFVLGSGDKDVKYCESCGWTVTSVAEASLLLARGTFTINDGSDNVVNKNESAETYEHALSMCLEEAAKRKLPMLVANPDKVRPDKHRPPMPGKIGDKYEARLREGNVHEPESLVKRIGKPLLDVYDIALRDCVSERSRVVMVGDALETDVVGGTMAGVDAAWVLLDGIHSPDIDKHNLLTSCKTVVENFNARSDETYAKGEQLMPELVMPHFRW